MDKAGSHLRFLKTIVSPSVAYYTLLYIERAMETAGIRAYSNKQSRPEFILAKILSHAGLMWNLRRSSNGPLFVSFMSYSEFKVFPCCYWTEIIPYCFDCWPQHYDRWLSLFKRHRVRVAFFSARQSAAHFAETYPRMKSVWLPEATDPTQYSSARSLLERDIDVLELGRRNSAFHSRVRESLARTGRVHLYERVKGEIIFPSREGLIDGLGRARISICFPCSLTHPERSGPIETVTHRYFESIASKCLIVGHAPAELTDLFGYNPVIEAEDGREFEQIDSILNNLSSFEALVERNYKRLLQVGTWTVRVEEILANLRNSSIGADGVVY
jgi:hypothetical protein